MILFLVCLLARWVGLGSAAAVSTGYERTRPFDLVCLLLEAKVDTLFEAHKAQEEEGAKEGCRGVRRLRLLLWDGTPDEDGTLGPDALALSPEAEAEAEAGDPQGGGKLGYCRSARRSFASGRVLCRAAQGRYPVESAVKGQGLLPDDDLAPDDPAPCGGGGGGGVLPGGWRVSSAGLAVASRALTARRANAEAVLRGGPVASASDPSEQRLLRAARHHVKADGVRCPASNTAVKTTHPHTHCTAMP